MRDRTFVLEAAMPAIAPEDLCSAEDIAKALGKICEAYRFNGYMVMVLRDRAYERLSDHIVMSNWPTKLIEQYDSGLWSRSSPVFDRLRKSTIPFTFDVSATDKAYHAPHVHTAFDTFNLVRGVYIPVHDSRGVRGAIGLSGDREEVRVEEMLPLNIACGVIFQRICDLNLDRATVNTRLSDREIECLRWAADGKTANEVAAILGLSEYTVTHYLNRAAQKLDSVNRVQAVVKALRARLIS